MASGAWVGRSKSASTAAKARRYPFYVICINNRGQEISLLLGKIYKVIRPLPGDLPYDLRVIDEEGEDYLYPQERFLEIELPKAAEGAVRRSVLPSKV